MELDFTSLLVIVIAAALAPIVVDVVPWTRPPVVVIEILLGIIIGQQVLGLAEVDPLIDFLSNFGLAFLFFLAGFEIDFEQIRGRSARLGVVGWLVSLALAFGIAALLEWQDLVASAEFIGLCLATTALGTLMPILRDAGELGTRFGTFVIGAGTVGEFGPIILIAFLFSDLGAEGSTLLLLLFAACSIAGAVIATRYRPPRIIRLLAETMHASAQFPVRLSIALLVALVYLATEEGLDFLLGAFTAGIVIGLVAKTAEAEPLRIKLDGIGFGLLIPIFFIVSGMNFDLDSLFESPSAIVKLPIFLGLFLVVRGLPALLYRTDLPRSELTPLALLSATALPLIVAITSIALAGDRMRPDTAAALVGAGMVSVFVYPLLALALRRRSTEHRVAS